MYAKSFPEVGYFFGDGVDDMGDLVADDELDVLREGGGYFGGDFVAHEEAFFDFDGAGEEFDEEFGFGGLGGSLPFH